jgi:uncharacterized protein YndB with AHSA1/START domain
MRRYLCLLPLAMAATSPAFAEVASSTPYGFETLATVDIAASPEEVYAALGKIGQWWDPEHTYSGDAAKLSIVLRPGGCFCERLDGGGGIEHMRVVYARPNDTVRLRGALGPVQAEGADGALTWSLKPADGGVSVTQRYVVGGYIRSGSEKLAPAVDRVLSTQLARLKRYVESGEPGAHGTR